MGSDTRGDPVSRLAPLPFWRKVTARCLQWIFHQEIVLYLTVLCQKISDFFPKKYLLHNDDLSKKVMLLYHAEFQLIIQGRRFHSVRSNTRRHLPSWTDGKLLQVYNGNKNFFLAKPLKTENNSCFLLSVIININPVSRS